MAQANIDTNFLIQCLRNQRNAFLDECAAHGAKILELTQKLKEAEEKIKQLENPSAD